jgi:predicted DNA-binding transcriptional regulator YafY
MPINRNALVRYKTIDKCLQNYYRQWTLEDLVEACSDALYEYEGIKKGVGVRTVQADIQMMRSDKLGYNAPIVVVDRKYYEYEDRNYSITNIPITGTDLSKLSESVEFLKQFKGFGHFREIEGVIHKLEDHVYSQKNNQKPIIDFDRNQNVKGLEFLDQIYQAILQKSNLRLWYKTFRANQSITHEIQPLLIKEFRNRWYVIALKDNEKNILNFALDRIEKIEKSGEQTFPDFEFDQVEYYKDVIGVTVEPGKRATEINLWINNKTAPYILTKPLHSSQKMVKETGNGVIISLYVQHNYELEKEILSFGENVKVLFPSSLKQTIKKRIENLFDNYITEITDKQIINLSKTIVYKGFITIQHVFNKIEINQLVKYYEKSKISEYSILNIDINSLHQLNALKINENLFRISEKILVDYYMTNVFFTQTTDIKMINSISYETQHKNEIVEVIIPLDIDKEQPDFFQITPEYNSSALQKNKNLAKTEIIYLLHGSIIIKRQKTQIFPINKSNTKNSRYLILIYEFKM